MTREPMGHLRFHLLGFPVIVQPGFWILALLLGSSTRESFPRLIMLTGVLFVSVLAHELGHALVARRHGQQPVITLHTMGGLTSWRASGPLSRGATILITLAGPSMGLLLASAAVGALYARVGVLEGASGSDESDLHWLLSAVAQMNLFWSAINLLPVLPLDGGQVMAAALGYERRRLAALVSLVVGLVGAGILWKVFRLEGAALILGIAGISQFAALLRAESKNSEAEAAADELLRRCASALDAGNYTEASALGRGALALSRDRARLNRAAAMTAWAALHLGELPVASALCERLGDACDVRLKASVLEASGKHERALELLRAARAGGDTRSELAAQLVRLELDTGALASAATLTTEIAEEVPSQDIREVARRVVHEIPGAAAGLFACVYLRDRDPDDAAHALRAWKAAGLTENAATFLRAHADDVTLAGVLAQLVEEDPTLSGLTDLAG